MQSAEDYAYVLNKLAIWLPIPITWNAIRFWDISCHIKHRCVYVYVYLVSFAFFRSHKIRQFDIFSRCYQIGIYCIFERMKSEMKNNNNNIVCNHLSSHMPLLFEHLTMREYCNGNSIFADMIDIILCILIGIWVSYFNCTQQIWNFFLLRIPRFKDKTQRYRWHIFNATSFNR